MAYATRADLTTFSLPAGALGGVSADKQDAALEAASRFADGFLNVVYTLPLTEYGSDLRRAVCDIAAFILMKGRGFSPETADADMLQSAERAATQWLQSIAAGKVKPYGLMDSSAGGINVDDTGAASHPPLVVQVQEGSASEEDFWRQGGGTAGSGAVGASRRRGW